MPRLVRIALIALAVVIGLLAIAAAIIAATFDPNDYKPLIIRLVQEKKQRTLSIPGKIKLTFFPKIGVDLGQVGISEHNGSAEFASVRRARLSLALWPLLSKQWVVDRVMIDGLRADLKRFKDGTTNVDDLLSKDASGQQIQFDIDSVALTDAAIRFDDQRDHRQLALSRLNLDTGKIANGAASNFDLTADIKDSRPAIDAALAAKSGFTIDLDQSHYVLRGLDVDLKGKLADFSDLVFKLKGNADLKPSAKQFALDAVTLSASGNYAGQAIGAKFDTPRLAFTDRKVAGGKVTGELRLAQGGRTVSADFSLPSFEGSPQAFQIPALALNAAIKDGALDAQAKLSGALSGNIDKLLLNSPKMQVTLQGKRGEQAISGTLSTPLAADLEAKTLRLAAITAAFALPNPAGGRLDLKADGHAAIDLGKQTLTSAFKGKLDDSTFDAVLGLSGFSPPAYNFNIGIDRLDADRYRAKSAPATTAAGPEKPLDLSTLNNLHATGNVRIDALKVENLRAANVRFGVQAAGGKLDLNGLGANLYGGSLAGSLSLAAANPPHVAVHQKLSGISVDALLKDAITKDPIEGKGNVQLDVTTQGATVSQMKRGLNGNARLELRDGAVRGVNIAQAIRNAKAAIGAIRGGEAPKTGTGSSDEKTDFSELSGSFRITNGVAHNDDLAVKSPLLRLGGSGDINLGDDRLDYLVKATVVQTLQGQGGPELQALKGVTVPVRLSGPFTAIGWRIDFAGMASELARQKVDEKKEEVKAKAQQAIDQEKAKLQEQLKEGLKGLLGK